MKKYIKFLTVSLSSLLCPTLESYTLSSFIEPLAQKVCRSEGAKLASSCIISNVPCMKLTSQNNDHSITVTRMECVPQPLRDKKFLPLNVSFERPWYAQYHDDHNFLSKVYLALTQHTGESDDSYDSFKGSFSFQFLLSVSRKENMYNYWLHIFQFRSFMRSTLYQAVSKEDPREDGVYTNADNSFSKEEIESFSHYFMKHWMERPIEPFPFVKSSASNCMIYGYDQDYFHLSLASESEFIQKKKEMAERIESLSSQTKEVKPPEEVSQTLAKENATTTPGVLAAFERAKFDKLPEEVQKAYKAEDQEYNRFLQFTADKVKESTIEIAKALIDEGMKDDLIVRTTGLTLEQVQALRRGETVQ